MKFGKSICNSRYGVCGKMKLIIKTLRVMAMIAEDSDFRELHKAVLTRFELVLALIPGKQ